MTGGKNVVLLEQNFHPRSFRWWVVELNHHGESTYFSWCIPETHDYLRVFRLKVEY
jgi:hypothetical protein